MKSITHSKLILGNSVVIQWLGLGSIPGQGIKILQDTWPETNKQKRHIKEDGDLLKSFIFYPKELV